MNYQKHYDALIQRARQRELNCYTEKHHVIPECLGGTDDSENLVRLTAEEHFVAHQLLVKLNPHNPGLNYAVFMMGNVTNKQYAWLKRRYVSVISGPNHHNYGRPNSEEQKKKASLALSGRKFTKEHCDNISASLSGSKGTWFGVDFSHGHRLRLSESHKGFKNGFFGKTHSPDALRKLKESIAAQPIVICPHCGKEGKGGNMKRFHFDKCISLTQAERSLNV